MANPTVPAPPDMLERALAFAASSVPVFPCLPGGKTPITTHGFHDATTDPDTVRRWWSATPSANIATPTGRPGFDVLDVDVRPDGSGWAALHRAHAGGLLAGWIRAVRTPSGGLHLHYPGTEQRNGSLRGQHLDFRGLGGYVLLPPSIVQTPRALRPYELIVTRANPGSRLTGRRSRAFSASRGVTQRGPPPGVAASSSGRTRPPGSLPTSPGSPREPRQRPVLGRLPRCRSRRDRPEPPRRRSDQHGPPRAAGPPHDPLSPGHHRSRRRSLRPAGAHQYAAPAAARGPDQERIMTTATADVIPAQRMLLSVAEVAAELGCGRDLVYALLASGRLPSVQIGERLRRIRRDDLQAYVESLPVTPLASTVR